MKSHPSEGHASPDVFEEMAGVYEIFSFLVSGGMYFIWLRSMLGSLNPKPGERWVEMGCGTGLATRHFSRLYPGCSIIGLDISENMLAQALKKPKPPKGGFIPGDACSLPFPDGSVNGLFAAYLLRNIGSSRVDEVLSEAARCLIHGGRFVVLEVFSPSSPFWRRTLDVYLRWAMRFLSKLLRIPSAEEYFIASLESFSSPENLASRMESAGFRVTLRRLFPGFAVILEGVYHGC